jgi:peptidoglycan/xylan/chitin deacetylase (PgdA/CDA1 family)
MRRAAVAGVVVVAGVAAAFGAVLMKNAASPPSSSGSLTPSTPALAQPASSAPASPITDLPQIAQTASPTAAAPPSATAFHPPVPQCDNPNALGVSRVVEIDTTGGPGFGFEHFKELDFLRDHEVVLTFDDGPWPTTPAVLKALADQCVRATFFPIGKHATYYPEILRQVAAAGETIGTHTWSHPDLTKKTEQEGKEEIEKGLSAVHWALQGAQHAPFFRFPDLRHPPEMVTYLGTRNIAIFSTDIDSFDFKLHKPEQVVESVMSKLAKRGKGIILMHDFQRPTSIAITTILEQLKANGYKIVHMVPKEQATTLAEYDEIIPKEVPGGLQTVSSRPVSSVIRTIEGQ